MSKLIQNETPTAYQVTADYYDLVYQATAPADLAFYLELAGSRPGPVLELGCGTGRVTLELAKAGHRIVGLDLSSAMLAKLKTKLEGEPSGLQNRVGLVEGPMENFHLTEQFGLVIAPFRAFQHLLTVEAQRKCLACIDSHMLPGGRFVFNAFEPNLEYITKAMQEGPAWKFSNEGVGHDGLTVKRFFRNTYDTANQLITVNWKFEIFDGGGGLVDTRFEEMQLRWTYRHEALHLLELCGFEVLEKYADYQRAPLGEKALELIFICRKAKES